MPVKRYENTVQSSVYASPGAEFNTYADAVYVGEHPLGPFVLDEKDSQ